MTPRRSAAGWRHREIAFAAAVVFAALAVRYPFLSHESFDSRVFVSWYDFIAANGYHSSWRYDFAIYNPVYLYLLTAAAGFAPLAPKLLAVKGISILCEFVMASFLYRCVRLRYPGSRTIPLLAFGAVLLLPTVVLNGAWLGQSDAIYTALLSACLYGLLSGRRARACVAFGLAFSVKAQAAFLAPLLYWLWAKKELAGRFLVLIPLAYFLTLVPAWVTGRPLLDLLGIYFEQAGAPAGAWLFLGAAPNPWRWISADHYRWWPAGVLLTLALVHGVRRLLESRRFEMTRETVALLALFSALLTPYFLPKMFGRYFFPADVFAIVLAFYRPRLWYLPVGVGAASFVAYRLPGDSLVLFWSPALLGLLLADLTRRLLVEFGFRPGFGAAARWFRRRARVAAAAPHLALLLALAGISGAFAVGGGLDRPLANDGASARTLAQAAGRPSDHGSYTFDGSGGLVPLPSRLEPAGGPGLLGASRPALDAEGRVIREILPGGSAAFDHLLAAVLRHFGDDLRARIMAARALMLALFCGAALFAYLSLCRVLAFRWPARRDSNRWIALAATLLGFGSAAAAGADTVAVAGAPEVFGVFSVFHGMVVFLGEGRFGQLVGKSAAALLLGFGVAALLVPFVVLGLAGEWRRRRRRRAGGEGVNGVGKGFGSGAEPLLRPFPAVTVRGPIGSPYLALGAFCAVFAAVLAAAGGVGGPSGQVEGSGGGAATFGETLPEGLRRVGQGFFPAAAEETTGEGSGWAGAAAGALLAAAGLAGAALLRSFPLLVLALSGLGSALWLGRGAPPEAAALGALGLPLAAWTAGFAALRGRWRYAAAGAAVAAWAVSFGAASFVGQPGAGRPGVRPGGDRNPAGGAGTPEARAANERLREDFEGIRRVLRRREERTVFLPPLEVGGPPLAGARARFFLPEAVLTDDPARRRFAEFTVEAEPGTASGLLTPRNETAFLYHRAARDGELDALVEAAGAPRARSEFDVHLGGGRLLFVKDDCRPEHLEGTFIVHLVPEDPDDLPPHRKQYGFENLSFPFHHRAYETGARCVAGLRFPDYPIRSVAVGRSFRRPDASYERVWREEFAPGRAARPFGGGR